MESVDKRLQSKRLKVICGANVEYLEDCGTLTVEEIRQKVAGIMNISDNHKVVLVNAKPIQNPADYLLNGDEEVEFKREDGQKG
ncbi:MAG: hypothetical protein Q7K16_00445 [Candidatus Azambacteria bacterium]|nr:hypothetical protein [Candidatus Azambacteria bacterium]